MDGEVTVDWATLPGHVWAVINAYPDLDRVSFAFAIRPGYSQAQTAEIQTWVVDRCRQYAGLVEGEPLWRWHNLEALHQLMGVDSGLTIDGGT